MHLYSIKAFFDKLNSEKTKEYKIDSWTVKFDYGDKKIEKIMLLYLGLGCDGKVAKTVDVFRNRFPFLFRSNKVNRFFYFASFLTHWFPEILGIIKTKLTDINFFIDKK